MEYENNDEDNDVVVVKSTFICVDSSETTNLLPTNVTGLSWQKATLFISGELVGGGMVAIGDALASTGWYGIIVLVLCCVLSLYVALLQAESYMIAAERDAKFKAELRHPYTALIGLTLGKRMEKCSLVLLNSLVLITTTAYMLIASELTLFFINEFFPGFNARYGIRIMLVILVVLLIPLTWLGTPKEYWGVALAASLTIVISAILIMINLWLNRPNDFAKVPRRTVTANTFFYGFGTFIFAFNAIPFIPNIHADMKIKGNIFKSILMSYMFSEIIYGTVAISGMLLLGDNIKGNVIMNTLQTYYSSSRNMQVTGKVLSYSALILLAGHFVFAYNLIFNIMAQEIEERLAIPKVFCWQRCCLRTGLALVTFTVAQIIPDFNIILSIGGGTLMTVLSFHFPILSYFKIKDRLHISRKIILVVWLVLVSFAFFGTIYSNIERIMNIYS